MLLLLHALLAVHAQGLVVVQVDPEALRGGQPLGVVVVVRLLHVQVEESRDGRPGGLESVLQRVPSGQGCVVQVSLVLYEEQRVPDEVDRRGGEDPGSCGRGLQPLALGQGFLQHCLDGLSASLGLWSLSMA